MYRLNSLQAQKMKKVGLHADGGGLYLSVSQGTGDYFNRSWIFRFERRGKRRDMGLGSLTTWTLAEARDMARECRQLVAQGIDPLEKRKAERAVAAAKSAAVLTFDEAFASYVRANRAQWSPQHAREWEASVKRLALPILGKLNVADIGTAHIQKVLEPIWQTIPQTAARLRGRLEAILAWATVSEFRSADAPNPARWENHLDKILPKIGKLRQIKRMATLPIDDMPLFMFELRQQQNKLDALALEFTILTAVRTADILAARWADFDFKNKVWGIKEFSKTRKEHRVPLSDAALHILDKVRDIAIEKSDRVFPGLHKNSMLIVLQRMGRAKLMTAHGARAAFRSWAQERTNFPREVCELCLGHTIGSAVEQAYARSDLLTKRNLLMQQWATFLATPADDGKVIPLSRSAAGE
jgi:integrase